MRVKPLGFPGRGALPGGRGSSRRSRKGEEGATGFFFFFNALLRLGWGARVSGRRPGTEVSVSVLVLCLRLRARSGRSPWPVRRSFRRGAAAATAAIAAASLAMWLHFVDSPARRPPPPPALLPLLLLLLHRFPPSRARSLALGWRRWPPYGRASCTSGRGAAAETTAPGAVAAGAEGGRRGRRGAAAGRPGAREPAPLSGVLPGLLLPGSEAAAAALASSRLARSLAPSAALTHVLLTEQNPNYSPALPPTSATLSHWAAGLFRRNNKTCQSEERQRDA